MPYSFRSPVVDGKIWSPVDGEVDLSIFGENKIPYVESVEIVHSLGGNFELTVNLSLPYLEAVRLIDETGWLRLGNTIAVRWGYNDGDPTHLSDWYYGFMLPPEPSFSAEDTTLAIKASGYDWVMNRTESIRVWSKNGSPMTFEAVATEISTRYGLKPPEFLLSTDTQKNLLQGERVNLVQGGLTDFMYLSNEATLAGAEMIFKQDHLLFVGRMDDTEKGKVAAEFRMHGKPDLVNNIYPMDNFTPKSFGPLFLAKGGSFSTDGFGPNSDPTKEPEILKADTSTDQGNNPGGEEVLSVNTEDGAANEVGIKQSIAHEDGVEAVKFVPVTMTDKERSDEVNTALEGMRNGDASANGIEADIDSVAIPALFPGQHVRLSGVTAYFSTEYRIISKTVTIDEGGAAMTMHLGSKGLPAGLENMVKSANVSNQGEVESDGGNVSVEPEGDASL